MKIFRGILTLCLALTAISTFGATVKTDYDRDFNLGALKTFAFQDQERGDKDPLKTNTLMSDRIKAALASQLEVNGYQPSDNPDFLVAYYAGSKERLAIESFGYGYPRYWRWGLGPNLWTRYYTVGSIVTDVIDPKTNQLVWRGIVSETVGNKPDLSEKQVTDGVKDLLEHFRKDVKKTS